MVYYQGDIRTISKIPLHEGNIVSFLEAVRNGRGTPTRFQCEKSLLPYIEDAHYISRPISASDAVDLLQTKKAALVERKKVSELMRSGDPKASKRIDEEDEKTVRAKFLELALIPLQEAQCWFGDDAHLSKTNEFDDWKRSTDLVLTMDTLKGPLHLAIDVTISNSDAIINEKVEEIERRIEKGQLTEVKYFEDPTTRAPQTLKDVPRVILPMAPDTLDELKQLTVDFFADNVDKKRRKETETSSIPYAILDTFSRQLERYRLIALKSQTNRKTMLLRIDAVLDELRRRRHAREKVSGKRPLDYLQRRVVGI